MANRIKINSAAKEGMFSIVAFTDQGDFLLNRRFGRDCPKLVKTLRQIEATGSIDPTLWTKKSFKKKGRKV